MSEFELRHGENMDLLPLIPDCSIDSCVTDPPYGIGFMGKKWDGQGIANNIELWKEVLRVLKPGGHLLAFGGSRTWHRMVCAIEDAGFELRDTICWHFAQGFPKSLDLGKAIDKAAGVSRERLGTKIELGVWNSKKGQPGQHEGWARPWMQNPDSEAYHVTAPATDAAKQWDGWGTALKPATEFICLARKPLSEKTVAANVLKWGTGALNIDGCRVPSETPVSQRGAGGLLSHIRDGKPYPNGRNGESSAERIYSERGGTNFAMMPGSRGGDPTGRWPSNAIFAAESAAELDRQSGFLTSGARSGVRNADKTRNAYGVFKGNAEQQTEASEGDASRFFKVVDMEEEEAIPRFRYVAKASTSERGEGNNHPTVKPVELMQYLCRLITPPGGTVIDPFCGSGSTGIAALREGFRFLGLEREAEYVVIARNRILSDAPLLNREVTA